MNIEFIISGRLHERLQRHLYPGDGLEAVALVACGHRDNEHNSALLAKEIFCVPYNACTVRSAAQVSWPTSVTEVFLETCAKNGYSVAKVHSHPTGYRDFSDTDDISDRALFPSLYGWLYGSTMLASLIMLPDGSMIGRTVSQTAVFAPISTIKYVGDDLRFWPHGALPMTTEESVMDKAALRLIQTFGQGTYRRLRQLRIGIVGLSGIGSILTELLARNCVGTLVLVEPDIVEEKNLNRMINSRRAQADAGERKVDVLTSAIEAMGLSINIESHPTDVCSPNAVRALASCDAIFGGMDSIYGRHLVNRLASFYLIPYFDAGVKLVSDGKGGIDSITAAAHYLQPDGSSLMSRGVYSQAQLEADGIRISDPEQYERLLKEGYIKGINEDRPAVITINALAATMAVNDFLARIHPYREDGNSSYAMQFFSVDKGFYHHEGDGAPSPLSQKNASRGDVVPLLDRPDLSE